MPEMHQKTVFSVFRNGFECRVVYGSNPDEKPSYIDQDLKERSEVTIFSKKSQKRLNWVYANGPWKSMITLTYHKKFPDYQISKGHLDTVLKVIKRMGLNYLWVVEFQGRGFPHYHIWMSEILRPGTTRNYLRISNAWLRATRDYNDTPESVEFHHHPKIYTDWDVNLNLAYAAKYAQKQRQKWLPIGIENYGRWWGTDRFVVSPEREADFLFNPVTDIHITSFKRNIRRCIYHWSRRKKKKRYDKMTNCSFKYVLSNERKRCFLRLYEEMISCIDNDISSISKKTIDNLPF